jgi:hypothetical protein
MKQWLHVLLAALAATAGVACFCTKGPLSNGGVSETTNGVSACIVYPGGKACANSIVRVRPRNYLASVPGAPDSPSVFKIDSLTDLQGRFHLRGIIPGDYIIEVADSAGNAIAFTVAIADTDSLVKLGTDTIRPAGAVSGSLANAPAGTLFVQVMGLEFVAEINSETSDFVCTGIPPGTFDFRIVSSGSDSLSTIVPQVVVRSDDTTDIGPVSLWQNARQIVLNTSQSGAGVGESVIDFPVLIHLTSSTLDFSQVKGNGGDLRFFSIGKTSLPYEIEQWDSVGQNALVWVKVDTVFGNNDTQSVLMVWGNPDAMPQSNGVVFDTAQGFQGVWHFNEAGDAPCLDATKNRYTGTSYGMSPQSSVLAAIGLGRKFDGSSSRFQMHGTAAGKLNFPENGNYTISAWVFLDTADTGNQVIVSKGYWQYFLKASHDSAASGYSWNFVEYHANNGWQKTADSAEIQSWTYVVAQRRGDRQYLYVNGVPADSMITMIPDTMPRDTGNDFMIGRYIQAITTGPSEGFGYFHGSMDEVCVSNVARNPAWIRLCYMNQRANDALVRFK